MRLINRAMNANFPLEKVRVYNGFSGELQLREKEQSLRWEVSVQIIEAILPGKPKIEVLQKTNEGAELLSESLLLIKIQGEPAFGPVPLMGSHGRMTSLEGLHAWFEADLEDGSKPGIFLTNGDIVEVTVLSPWAIQTGNLAPRIHVTIGADLCQTIREGTLKSS